MSLETERSPTPGLTFVAKFSVAVRAYTADDDDMVCVDLFIDFVSQVLEGLSLSC